MYHSSIIIITFLYYNIIIQVKAPSKKDKDDASLLVKVCSRNQRQRAIAFKQYVKRRRCLADRLILQYVVGPKPGVSFPDHVKGKIIDGPTITKAFPGDLGSTIISAITSAGMNFPVTLAAVYKHGCRSRCQKCAAMIMLDGQMFRGTYRRQRLTFDPEFEVRRMNKTKTSTVVCTNFCNNPQHPLRIKYIKKLEVNSKKALVDRIYEWGYPQRLNHINRALLPHFQRMANQLGVLL